MKVKARCWIKHGNTWHKAGDTFNVEATDIEGLKGCVETVAEAEKEPEEPAKADEPVKHGRKRKTEE